ncbi:BnaCnng34920D [Brassica napus]|uniref:BnaCnng34920D protein n=1 Tax=Brassica napus TaxID=3708 RepID=A0A078J5E6_BRANA|nr:BnaCnng34920D [Brassica napus]
MLRLNYDANLEASSVKSCDVSWVGSNRGRRQVSSITPGTLLIILAGRFKGKRKVSTHREKDDQMAVDGALIKAIEVVSELNTCLCTVFIAQGMEPHKLVF